MTINEFGQNSFVTHTTGLKERIQAKENQMRPYRGWTKDGEEVHGWYAEVEGKSIIISPDSVLTHPRGFIYDFTEVIPETIGQFTGLKDKKRTKEYPEGQKIYKGDIVNMSYVWHFTEDSEDIYQEGNYIGEIVILATRGVCIKNPIRTGERNGVKIETCRLKQYKAITACRCEVIGDIHTTPELLEQNNDSKNP